MRREYELGPAPARPPRPPACPRRAALPPCRWSRSDAGTVRWRASNVFAEELVLPFAGAFLLLIRPHPFSVLDGVAFDGFV